MNPVVVRWIFAAFHLLALGIGLGAIYTRARALRGTLDGPGLSRVFLADTFWGIAGGLWVITGLVRAFGGLEKGTLYYLHSHLFHAKLGLFVLILALEIWPMITLIGWRVALKRNQPVDTSRAVLFARISHAQMGLVVIMVFVATALARGF